MGVADDGLVARVGEGVGAGVDHIVVVEVGEDDVARVGDAVVVHPDTGLLVRDGQAGVDVGPVGVDLLLVAEQTLDSPAPDITDLVALVVVSECECGVVVLGDEGTTVGKSGLDTVGERLAEKLHGVMPGQRKFPSSGAHVGVVALRGVGAIGVREGGTGGIHIIGTPLVPVEGELQPAGEHTQVEAGINRLGGLPGEVVRDLAGSAGVAHSAYAVEAAAPFADALAHSAIGKFLHKSIGADAAVAELAEGAADLEACDPLRIHLEPVLLGYTPRGGSGREKAPLAIGRELGGTVVTAVDLEEISFVVGVVETEHKTGNPPAAFAGGYAHIVADGEVYTVGVVGEQVVTLGGDGLPLLLLVVVAGHRLEVVLLLEGVLILGVGVDGYIVGAGGIFLQVVVEAGGAEIAYIIRSLAVRDYSALTELGLAAVGVGEVGVDAEGVLEEVGVDRGRRLVVADLAVGVVVARHEAADGVGAGHCHRAVRVEDRRTGTACHVDGSPEVAGALLVGSTRDVVELVVEGDVLGNLEPGADVGAHLGAEVEGVVFVRTQLEEAVVPVETSRDIVAENLAAAADGDVVGVGKSVFLVEEIVVVGVAVVDVLAVGAELGRALVAGQLTLAEVLEPGQRKGLHLVHRVMMLAGDGIVGLVEQAGIDITVRDNIGNGGRIHYGDAAGVIDLGLGAGVGVLGRDDDHAVGSPGSVDRGRGGVLEDGDALDVVGVEGRGVAFNTVDEDEGRTAGADGGGAADVVVRGAARLTIDELDVEVGDDALEHLGRVGDRASFEDLGADLVDRARKVLLLDGAVAHDNDFLQELGRGLKHNLEILDVLRGDHCVVFEADGTGDESGACRDGEGEVAVETGHGTLGRAFNQDGGAYQRLPRRGLDHNAAYRYRVLRPERRSDKDQNEP